MATAIYPAVIERAGDTFSVFFPDLPGCVSAGQTVHEAALNAEEALAGHLIECASEGEDIPAPSELDNLEVDEEVEEISRLLVRVELPGKPKRINVMMDEGLLAAIDKASSNRSRFLSEAARARLQEKQYA